MELCAQLNYVESSGEQECSDPTSEQFDFISQVQVLRARKWCLTMILGCKKMNMFMEMELRWGIEVKKTSAESVLTAKY